MKDNYVSVKFVNLSISCLGVFDKECRTFLEMLDTLGLQSWTKYMAKMAFYSLPPNINVVCANTPILRKDFPENSNIDIGGGTSVPKNRIQ